MRSPRLASLLLASLAAVAGCAIDRTGLGARDGSVAPPPDALPPDALPIDGRGDAGDAGADGALDANLPPPDDAGCQTFESPAPLWTLVGTARDQGFGDPASERSRVETDPLGQLTLALQRYRYGGLLVRGHDGFVVSTTPSSAELRGRVPTGARIGGDLGYDFGSGTPPFLSMTRTDTFTVEAVGEVFLRAGTWTFELEADDRGFLEVTPASGRVERVVASGPADRPTLVVSVAADAWYPIHAAMSDTGGGARLQVRVGPDAGSLAVVPGGGLRADVAAVVGRELLGFDASPPGATVHGSRLEPGSSANDFGAGRPPDVGISRDDVWSARWLGRHVFPGHDSPLRGRSDGPHRLWVDGIYVGGDYFVGVYDETYATGFGRGVHDVVLDLDENVGDAYVELLLDGRQFPETGMRPATRFGGTAFGAGGVPPAGIVLPGGLASLVTVLLAPSTDLRVVEVSAVVETASPTGIDVVITEPDASAHTIALSDGAENAGGDVWHFRHTLVGSSLPTAVQGPWTVTVRSGGGATATFRRAGVLAHQGGDPQPYPVVGTFVSGIIDLGERTRVTGVEPLHRAHYDTGLQLWARAADSAAALDAARFWDATLDGLSLAGPAVGRYVQVQARLTGPGWDTPRVEHLHVVGGACAE